MKKKSVQKKVSQEYWHGTGRRKTSIASARIYKKSPKENQLLINSKKGEDFFSIKELVDVVLAPLKATASNSLRAEIIVKGGGIRGQAEASRHAISRALVKFDEKLRKQLKDLGYLTRDPRMVERKKPGLKKARRAPQFSKR
jgi:small subunit ribosomal protein S9